MTDNTQVNNGSGDFIRDLDRGTAKTQVVQIDAGGQSAESLVSQANPLPVGPTAAQAFAGGVPVVEANLEAAQSSDQPLFTALVGDPNGDFAGVNLIEQVMTDGSGLGLNVKVISGPGKFDAQGAAIPSDAPLNIPTITILSGSPLVLDTQGYASVAITLNNATTTVIFDGSNDGINFGSVACINLSTGTASVTNVGGGPTSYVVPCTTRYLRIKSVGSAASVSTQLRNAPFINPVTQTNITQINGSNVVNPGVNGTLAIGGPTAAGNTTAQGPVVIGGVDQSLSATGASAPLVRHILTDSAGRVQVTPGIDAQGNTNRQVGVLATSYQNVPTELVQDVAQFEGTSQIELLAQLLLEARINNQILSELPAKLYAIFQSLQLAPTTQNQFAAGVVTDDPQSYRNDPSLFN